MRSVLIVEPHSDTRDLYAAYFEFEGYDVETAVTTDDALERASRVDAVVTELLVPGTVTNYAFLHALRNRLGTGGPVVVVLTTQASDACKVEAQRAGCNVFLAKPCLPARLCSVVNHALRRNTGKMAKAGLQLRQDRRGA